MAHQKAVISIPADLIPTAQAAALKGLSMRTMAQHAQRGLVPGAFKFGSSWMFSRAAIEKWTPRTRGRPKV